MTVKELIERLEQLPQDKQVILHDTCLDFWVKCSGVDERFEFAENAIALTGHEVSKCSIEWDFDDEEEEDED